MKKKKEKKFSSHNNCRRAIISIFSIYILFVIIFVLASKDRDAAFLVALAIGLVVVFGSLVASLAVVSGEYDKNSIRFIQLEFSNIEIGIGELEETQPWVFTHCNWVNTYIYNRKDKCFYEIKIKDNKKSLVNIGKIDPREKY